MIVIVIFVRTTFLDLDFNSKYRKSKCWRAIDFQTPNILKYSVS